MYRDAESHEPGAKERGGMRVACIDRALTLSTTRDPTWVSFALQTVMGRVRHASSKNKTTDISQQSKSMYLSNAHAVNRVLCLAIMCRGAESLELGTGEHGGCDLHERLREHERSRGGAADEGGPCPRLTLPQSNPARRRDEGLVQARRVL